eukprot:scaffold253_cov243-Pinguiococcus_pyrenoidosus.AAC.10
MPEKVEFGGSPSGFFLFRAGEPRLHPTEDPNHVPDDSVSCCGTYCADPGATSGSLRALASAATVQPSSRPTDSAQVPATASAACLLEEGHHATRPLLIANRSPLLQQGAARERGS